MWWNAVYKGVYISEVNFYELITPNTFWNQFRKQESILKRQNLKFIFPSAYFLSFTYSLPMMTWFSNNLYLKSLMFIYLYLRTNVFSFLMLQWGRLAHLRGCVRLCRSNICVHFLFCFDVVPWCFRFKSMWWLFGDEGSWSRFSPILSVTRRSHLQSRRFPSSRTNFLTTSGCYPHQPNQSWR